MKTQVLHKGQHPYRHKAGEVAYVRGAIKTVQQAIDDLYGASTSYLDRTGTTLSPTNAGDNFNLTNGGVYQIDDVQVVAVYNTTNLVYGNTDDFGIGVQTTTIGFDIATAGTVVTINRCNVWGYKALEYAEDIADFNVQGNYACQHITKGEDCTITGNQAHSSNALSEMYRTTTYGYQAGLNSDADDCVYVGRRAGAFNTRDKSLYIAIDDDYLIYGEFDTPMIKIDGHLEVTEELVIQRYDQGTEPTLTESNGMVMWRDSATNKVYIIYLDADEGQKKVELT